MTTELKIIRVVTLSGQHLRYRVATVEVAIELTRKSNPTDQVVDAYDVADWSEYGGMKPTGTPSSI